MDLSNACINRPVATLLMMASVVFFGLLSYQALPISELPEIQFPVISVSASLPGADPNTMAATVAQPLENAFASVPSVIAMTSTSAQGSTQITLQFDLSRDIDAASQDVQAAISASLKKLPQDLPTPPTLRKLNPADQPIYYLYLQSDTLALSKVDDYAENVVVPLLSTIPGVAQVNIFGTQKYAVRIQVNPEKLARLKLDLNTVQAAIASANVNQAIGSLDDDERIWVLKLDGQLTHAGAYNDLIISYVNDAPIRIQDIGEAIDDVQNNKVGSWINGKKAVTLAIQRQAGSNTVAIAEAIDKLLPSLKKKIPETVSLAVLYERAGPIKKSIQEVQQTLLLSVLLVLGIIYVFLKSLTATFITSLVVPLSLIGSCIGMYLAGFSLDSFSLLAMTLAVGFVVDDAIVMLENIARHREAGLDKLSAARIGASEISFTIVSMTLSLTAVFIPIFFMPGFIGRIFHEFAATIGMTILLSGLISISLMPMLLSRVTSNIQAKTVHKSAFWQNFYARTLRWSLGHQTLILMSFCLTLVLTAVLFIQVKKGFIPSEDVDQIIGYTQGPDEMAFAEMRDAQQKFSNLILQDPDVILCMSSVGAGGARATTSSGTLLLRLKPKASRKDSADEIIQRLRSQLHLIASPVKVTLQNPPSLRVDARSSTAQYQYTLQGLDNLALRDAALAMEQALKGQTGFIDVASDLLIKSPTLHFFVDRDKASSLGITIAQIESTLASAFASLQVSTIYTDANQYQVILELQPQYQLDLSSVEDLYLQAPNGAMIALGDLVGVNQELQALTINHQGQIPAVTLTFNLEPGMPLSTATNRIESLVHELQFPSSVSGNLSGAAQTYRDSVKTMSFLLIIAVIVIYVILGILYESFIHPLTILSGLPSAAFGALLALYLGRFELDLYSAVGLILLIGIVKKNAILIVDFALTQERLHKLSPEEAIYQACLTRIRPIMMTTCAAILGALPIALQLGSSSTARQGLGVAIVGGLLFSQIITLYLTPVIYLYFVRLNRRLDHYFVRLLDKFS